MGHIHRQSPIQSCKIPSTCTHNKSFYLAPSIISFTPGTLNTPITSFKQTCMNSTILITHHTHHLIYSWNFLSHHTSVITRCIYSTIMISILTLADLTLTHKHLELIYIYSLMMLFWLWKYCNNKNIPENKLWSRIDVNTNEGDTLSHYWVEGGMKNALRNVMLVHPNTHVHWVNLDVLQQWIL